ncbi:hypothetical protein [Chryseobacterium polytrichastri]|uniref:Uncharacterized protein n=1 Tax=Chryseobacterium polytrichastri TaxID=1302687 RepID=A0A1M6S2F8_9FLAO|nr:hypothetical protein [Chryseobacterium polytrichastri]SHK38668.1 hypothetical protein SAMN05444267_1003141 [Chryseobacterium polytrichastri]
MRKIAFVFFFLFYCFFYSQNLEVSDEEVYEAINFIIKKRSEKSIKEIKIITEDPNVKGDFKYYDDKILKEFFNVKDLKVIKDQYTTINDFVLNPKYIFNLRIIHKKELLSYSSSNNSFWTEFNKKHGNVAFMFVGKPLFTLDKKRVIINYGYYCGGLCGWGERVILKKVKNIWIIEKVVSGFIS